MSDPTAVSPTHRHQPHYEPDALEQRLLNELQTDFPLVSRPFAALGERVGVSEEETLERVARLKEAAIIRQISAIFDSRRLGYRSSLVAMRFDAEEVDAGAAVVSLHPGVSHNYRRNHRYNLWFTIAVPPGRSLESEVEQLAAKARPEQTWLLPTRKLYKIGVNLDTTGQMPVTATEDEEESIGLRAAKSWQAEVVEGEFAPDELAAVRALQSDLPLVPAPFAVLAEGAGLAESRLLELTHQFLEGKQLRRFAAVLRHRQAGFRANAMGVWAVPDERVDEVGQQLASYKVVSHCYQRPTYPDWPYALFTMIHARHADDIEEAASAMSVATQVTEYALLYSTKEYKKTRVRYFLDDDSFDVSSLAVRP
ncbi:MAG: Lrp/AsnC family transcriptional regulator [Armatimonadetes bacterium]|nr:Lrp/AsnC family transcriptional regulator [Armatimonadota bacterium]